MNTLKLKQRRFLALFAVGVTAAAIGVQAGYAHHGPHAPCPVLRDMVYQGPDHAGPATPCYVLEEIVYGPGASSIQDWQLRYGSQAGSASSATAGPTDVRSASEPAAASPAPVAAEATADGFDWIDAGIGASSALGVALALAGTTLVARRRSRLAEV